MLVSLLNNLCIMADNVLVSLMNIIAPRSCVMCGNRLVVGENVICSVCNSILPRTHYDTKPYDNEMARLLWGRVEVERVAALFYFKPQSDTSRIVYAFKYGNHPEYAEYMGRLAAKEMSRGGFFDGIDVIVPVPLARKRLRKRGYNQSLYIAKGIKEITDIPIVDNAVRRNTFTESQTHKSRWMRYENVEHAFELRNPGLLRGKHVLIVDDVMTTGSTILACAKELIKDGDVTISVFTLGITKY